MKAAPRIVLDTNVCLALFLYADPRCTALRVLLATHQAVATRQTREEWVRVLRDGDFPFDMAQRDLAAAACNACVSVIEPPTSARALPRCRDPDDQKFLELARDAGAVALYTRDRELLKLSRRTQRMCGFAVLLPDHP